MSMFPSVSFFISPLPLSFRKSKPNTNSISHLDIMAPIFQSLALTATLVELTMAAVLPRSQYSSHTSLEAPQPQTGYSISYGPRPYYIINNMTDSPLKRKLQSCENGPFSITDFSIGHRGGGTLQFPEETEESEMAGARELPIRIRGHCIC